MAMTRGTRGPLARLWDDGPVAAMTDGQLLDRFATRAGDAAEAAFAALVARHGPMVARVCRGQLRAEHDVEDAFQATFLVLVRRAGSIGERDLLVPWLYGVAHRVARKARAVAARRRGREGGPAAVDPPAPFDPATGLRVELAPVLHEEVDRLPAKYRQPVILCHLQGLTHAEAAHELAWPVGTVSVRLARARKILADRLARRGITASVTVVAATLTAEATAATLAPSWIHAVTLAAVAAASGLSLTAAPALVSAGAATLARRTSMTLLLSSWKWLTLPAAVALTTSTGAGLVGSVGPNQQAPAPPNPARVPVVPAPPAEPVDNRFVSRVEAAGQPIDRKGDDGSLETEADTIVLRGKAAGLVQAAGQLGKTNPDADFQLRVTGKQGSRVQFQARAPQGRTSFPGNQPPKAEGEQPPVVVPPVVAIGDDDYQLRDLPPGYFDLPALQPGDPGVPQPVRIGQKVVIEVLEALPKRPITGERVVRPDGTVSLGFYGDLPVVGLTRDQIKVKLIERLRHYLKDQVLGLISVADGKVTAIPPVESNRAFVDDQPQPAPVVGVVREPGGRASSTTPPQQVVGPRSVQIGEILVIEVLEALPGRPIAGERVVRPDGTVSLGFYGDVAVAGLTREQIKVKLIERLRRFLSEETLGLRVTNSRTGLVEAVAPAQSDRVFVADNVEAYQDFATEPAADGKVRIGQTLDVEVLEALPGRPIGGERMVQPDGTINLGFYGDLPVFGLTRDQIKVKVIELLRVKLSDESLGLIQVVGNARRVVAPVDSDRVFVEDVVPKPELRTDDEVWKLRGQVADLSVKLDAALGAIEQLRRDRPASKGEPAKVEPPRIP